MNLRLSLRKKLPIKWGEITIRPKRTRVNTQIRVPKIRLIDQDGEQVGIVDTAEALAQAQKANLDLVEISPNAEPPVCRIMDHGKYLFELNRRKKAQKKKLKQIHVKEVKFRPGTDVGDFQVKVRKICTFLGRGDKVKISLRFRGREMQHKELGLALLDRVKTELPEGYQIEQEPKMEGRQMTMIVVMGKGHKVVETQPEIEMQEK